MGRVRKKDQAELVAELSGMGLNRFLNTVMEASANQHVRLPRFVADAVAIDLQKNLHEHGVEPICPQCGSTNIRKNGKRGKIQRYQCRECGTHLTALTNTILDKSKYSWDVWVEVVQQLIAGQTTEYTQQKIMEDLHCPEIDYHTVWHMRMKVMYAISHIPSPTLRGVIQIDDTYLREGQKGSRNLENCYPEKLGKREPRYGYVASIAGTMGSEFTAITTAIDGSGHCVCRALQLGGAMPEALVADFIAAHTSDVAFICSDCDANYIRVFRKMNLPHYTKPSNYSKRVERAVEQALTSNGQDELTEEEYESLRERLWRRGELDSIRNRGDLTYEQFLRLKEEHELSLGKVNALHKDLKLELEKKTAGVSTKYLPYYLAWFEYLHNRRIDAGHRIASRADAQDILIEAIRTRVNLTTSQIEAIRKDPIPLPRVSSRYFHLLRENTDMIRAISDDAEFYFISEDGVQNFNRQDIAMALTDAELKTLAKKLEIKGWGAMSRTALIRAILAHPSVDDHLLLVSTESNDGHTDGVPSSIWGKYNYADHNRKIYDDNNPFPRQRFRTPKVIARQKRKRIAFLDVETTGTRPQYDELLQVAIVDLDGKVLFNEYVKPLFRSRWHKAERINHITNAMVADKRNREEIRQDVYDALAQCDVIVGWNVRFDLRMIYANYIDIPDDLVFCDLMAAYRDARKQDGEKVGRASLAEATEWLGIDWYTNERAHNAMNDAAVLIPIWKWIIGDRSKKPQIDLGFLV